MLKKIVWGGNEGWPGGPQSTERGLFFHPGEQLVEPDNHRILIATELTEGSSIVAVKVWLCDHQAPRTPLVQAHVRIEDMDYAPRAVWEDVR